MIYENWPERRLHRGPCGCPRCRQGGRAIDRLARRSLSAALAHAQHGRTEADGSGMEAEGRPSIDTLSACIRVYWTPPVHIKSLLSPDKLKDLSLSFQTKGHRIYRISHISQPKPLYIGRTKGPIVDRVKDHWAYIKNMMLQNFEIKSIAGDLAQRLYPGTSMTRLNGTRSGLRPATTWQISILEGLAKQS